MLNSLTKALLAIAMLSFFPIRFVAQNLVPNSSFESYSTCPTYAIEFDTALNWFTAPHCLPPELYNECDTTKNGEVNIPHNYWGIQYPRTGKGYAGFYARSSNPGYNVRKYLSVRLDSTLKAGVKYCLNFYLSLADTCTIGISSIGIYFSADTPNVPNVISNTWLLNYTPQFLNSSSNFITDKDNWVPVRGEYVASGGENFITIGNFS